MTVLPPVLVHPAWCSREGCQMPTGEAFHTRDVVALDLADADLVDKVVHTWMAIESTGDRRASIRLQMEDRGLALTPGQAVELGLRLLRAGRLAA